MARKQKEAELSCENLAETCTELLHLGSTDNSTPLPAALNCLNPQPFPVSSPLILSFKRGLSVIVFNVPTEISLCCFYNLPLIKIFPEHGLSSILSIVREARGRYSLAAQMLHAI